MHPTAGDPQTGGMARSTGTLLPKLDVFDPQLLTDPYPLYHRLRSAGPICRAGPGVYAVLSWAEIHRLLRDPRIGHDFPDEFRSPFRQLEGEPNTVMPAIVSALEPPRHTRIRRLLGQAMGPPELRRLHPAIEAEVGRLLREARDRGGLDAVTELALPLQTATAGALIGLPAEDRAEIARRGMELGRILILNPFVDPALGKGVVEAEWLTGYVRDLVGRRRRQPADDLASRLLAVRDGDDRLSEDEIVDNIVFMFFAGFETSMHVLGGGWALLLRFAEQLRRLRADPGLAAGAVEEILRYDAPIQWIARMAKEPIEVGGRNLRPGRALLLVLGSGNHDEAAYADPDQLDIGRRPNPHLSFGGGAHHCLGVALARAQAAIALRAMVAAFDDIAPAAPPVVREHPNLRGFTSVPLTVGGGTGR